ncbi:MAG: hypothetical protein NC041_06420 [Bacteroides sp.]|nr:hypothetical protein [Prevotella sp.]MCM1406930.1 hypothetical protein [Treponema brennaborense]MCM1470081.1 hypothetical protein [Bacteroides sp.]
MKKVLKLTAVLTASLIFAMSFIACSDNDDDNSGSSALQGLWLPADGENEGYYFSGDMLYFVVISEGKYYYSKEGFAYSVSGNTITANDSAVEYSLAGDTLILTSDDGDSKNYKKISATPTAISEEEFDKIWG